MRNGERTTSEGRPAPARPGGRSTVSVVVPTYRRTDLLPRCLDGLLHQTRRPDQVVVVRRDTDEGTGEVLRRYWGQVDEVVVATPGVLAAMCTGMAAATGDVIAFTDDDAVARPGWLERLLPHYDDPGVGAVGGRDVVHPPATEPEVPSDRVGRITAWGNQSGRHHLGVGPAVGVQVLKGVNMSFRRAALALPATMRGSGAQVHFEIIAGLWAAQRGWRLVYEPAAVVDHFHGPRFDDDRRGRPAPSATRNEAYNLVWSILSFERRLFWRRAAFGLLVGDRATPGLARAAVALAQRDLPLVRKLGPSLRGQAHALLDVARRRQPTVVRPPGA